MADKPTNRERLQQITAGIEQGIKELFESEKYMRYLSVMSRFHRYSVNNTMLIYMQKPDATLVAGYNKWKNQFERHVKRGEHGITIIAPTPFKKKIENTALPSSRPRRSRKRSRNRSWTRTPRPPSWTQRARRSWRNGKLKFPCSAR